MSNKKTALLSAVIACGVASAASADVKVTLGGNLDTQYGVVDQKSNFKWKDTSDKARLNSLNNSGEVKVMVDGTMDDSSFKYGGLMTFNANTSDAKGYNVNGDDEAVDSNVLKQAMMYVETPFGKVEVGSTGGAAQAMQVAPAQMNDWMYYVNPNTKSGQLNRDAFIQTANMFTNEEGTVGTKTLNANKINLYSPRFMGFMLGVTYIPDLQVRGTSSAAMASGKFASASNTSYKDVFQGGVNYENTFNDVSVKAAFLGEMGSSKVISSAANTDKQRKLHGYEAGLQVSYMGASLGGSYGSHGKSATTRYSTVKQSKYWSLGTAYSYGPATASLTYTSTTKGIAAQTLGANTLKTLSFGVNYKVAEGFMPYASVTNFKMKDRATATTASNKGNVFLVGSKLNF